MSSMPSPNSGDSLASSATDLLTNVSQLRDSLNALGTVYNQVDGALEQMEGQPLASNMTLQSPTSYGSFGTVIPQSSSSSLNSDPLSNIVKVHTNLVSKSRKTFEDLTGDNDLNQAAANLLNTTVQLNLNVNAPLLPSASSSSSDSEHDEEGAPTRTRDVAQAFSMLNRVVNALNSFLTNTLIHLQALRFETPNLILGTGMILSGSVASIANLYHLIKEWNRFNWRRFFSMGVLMPLKPFVDALSGFLHVLSTAASITIIPAQVAQLGSNIIGLTMTAQALIGEPGISNRLMNGAAVLGHTCGTLFNPLVALGLDTAIESSRASIDLAWQWGALFAAILSGIVLLFYVYQLISRVCRRT